MDRQMDFPLVGAELFNTSDPMQAEALALFTKMAAAVQGQNASASLTAVSVLVAAMLKALSPNLDTSLHKLGQGVETIIVNLELLFDDDNNPTRH